MTRLETKRLECFKWLERKKSGENGWINEWKNEKCHWGVPIYRFVGDLLKEMYL